MNPGSDDLRADIREAIERVWPGGVVEMTFDPDESWFHDVYQKLATAIRRIKGVLPVYEREPDGGPVWFDDSEPEEDPPDDQQPSRSWHQFFVSPEGQAFAFETEIENIGEAVEEDEDWDEPLPDIISGSGWTGWSISVSLLAPIAVVTLSEAASFEDGAFREPTIATGGFKDTGEQIDPEAEFLKARGERAPQKTPEAA